MADIEKDMSSVKKLRQTISDIEGRIEDMRSELTNFSGNIRNRQEDLQELVNWMMHRVQCINKLNRISWKGSSDYPYNFQNLFEGDSVGLSERYPFNTRKFQGYTVGMRKFKFKIIY